MTHDANADAAVSTCAVKTLLLATCVAFVPLAAAAQDSPAVSLGLTYTGDVWANTTGGLRRDEQYLDNLDITAAIDAEKAFNIPGGSFFFYGLYNNNNELSGPIVGDLQTVSNIDTTTAFRLYEAWYEQQFGGGAGSLKIGLYDLNSEFDAIDTASLFINSSHGIGADFSQTGLNGPSIFPVTSLAARVQFQVNDEVLVRAAVLDGVPGSLTHPRRTAVKLGNGDGALLVGEVEFDLDGATTDIGMWHYTSKFDDLEDVDARTRLPIQRGGNTGGYISAERQMTSPYNDERGLALFARIGFANSGINQFSTYFGAGGSYTGLIESRPDDQLGLAMARVTNGSSFRRASAAAGAPLGRTETNVELTYRAQLTEWLTIQPDAQWIINPGTDPTLKNAFVVGLRFEIGFGQDF